MLGQNALSLFAAAFAITARAHTSFTTLFVNGIDQGDGTCVRQPTDPQTSTFPVEDLTSSDMICGRNGLSPVAFTCPVATASTLTFEFRENPDGSAPGAIDKSHKGPCAVYMKQVTDIATATTASSPSAGWFKIYEDGYDTSTGQWCTEKLISANGLLSVSLPSGLPAGAYLVRPELLALHEAQVGDPQFYVGCAQIFVVAESSPSSTSKDRSLLQIPSGYEATIPGHVKPGDPSVTFNIYSPVFPYPVPGPPVFFPNAKGGSNNKKGSETASSSSPLAAILSDHNFLAQAKQEGVAFVPNTCLIKNANWCGVEVPRYSTEASCWDASENCFQQEAACYNSAPPSGSANCNVWDKKCMAIQAACSAGNFVGPPNYGQVLQQVEAVAPGPIPAAQ